VPPAACPDRARLAPDARHLQFDVCSSVDDVERRHDISYAELLQRAADRSASWPPSTRRSVRTSRSDFDRRIAIAAASFSTSASRAESARWCDKLRGAAEFMNRIPDGDGSNPGLQLSDEPLKIFYSQCLGHNGNAYPKSGNDCFPLWVLQVVGSNPAAPTDLRRFCWGIAARSVIVPPDIQRNIPETILLPRENRLKRRLAMIQSASAEVEFWRLP